MSMSLEDILYSHRRGGAVVMGILNVTPDSFSDGGDFLSPADAIAQAGQMIADGADIIDIGAESTRPGSQRISAEEQIRRLREILPAVCEAGVIVSIDTTLAAVAEFALDSGAKIINDISAGREDAAMLPLAAKQSAPVCLMHMLGQPETMQAAPQYRDVVAEVRDFLAGRIAAAEAAGMPREHCIVDPGIGFGKTTEHNLALLAGVSAIAELGCPVLVGPSCKRFIGELTDQPDPTRRLGGTIAACLRAYDAGASIFRVHDTAPVAQALTIAAAIRRQD